MRENSKPKDGFDQRENSKLVGLDWKGEERREAHRRYTVDRRVSERRKKYWFGLLVPTIIGLLGAGIISWGAYVTHVTYNISAKYEETFLRHIEDQQEKESEAVAEVNRMESDQNEKMRVLREDMNAGFRDLRDTQRDIYSLLLDRSVDYGHNE